MHNSLDCYPKTQKKLSGSEQNEIPEDNKREPL